MSKKIDLSMYKPILKNVLNSSDGISKNNNISVDLNKFKKEEKDGTSKQIKKMGRPTLFNEKLEKQISVKFSSRVYELIKEKANGVPATNYVRRLVLKDLGEI
jgi:predicted DNA binding CopG/RHH family protein